MRAVSLCALGEQRGLSILLVAACLVLSSCGRSNSHPKLPIGVVDLPRSNETITGQLGAYGWAISEDKIEGVAVYLDGVYLMDAMLGLSRPDVNKAFPGTPEGENAGWRAQLAAASLPAGQHELVFEARTSKGAIRDIGIVNVTIAH
jgi:hypothetical protein